MDPKTITKLPGAAGEAATAPFANGPANLVMKAGSLLGSQLASSIMPGGPSYQLDPRIEQNRAIQAGLAAGPAADFGAIAQNMREDAVGRVLGASAAIPQPQPVAPQTTVGGGVGGGAANTGMSLIQRRKEMITNRARQLADDQLASLATSEQNIRNQYQQGIEQVQSQLGQTQEQARTRLQQQEAVARQGFSDAQLELRRAARASGVQGSAFAELNNELTNQLSRNLSDSRTQTLGLLGNAEMVAQEALAGLEASLAKAIQDIESDRRLTTRERDAAIQDAEIAAMEQQFDIEKWYASQAARGSAASNAQSQEMAMRNTIMNAQNQMSQIDSQLNELGRLGMGPGTDAYEQLQNRKAQLVNQTDQQLFLSTGQPGMFTGFITPAPSAYETEYEKTLGSEAAKTYRTLLNDPNTTPEERQFMMQQLGIF